MIVTSMQFQSGTDGTLICTLIVLLPALYIKCSLSWGWCTHAISCSISYTYTNYQTHQARAMAQRSTTAAVNMALYYALLSFFFALYFQAQGEGICTRVRIHVSIAHTVVITLLVVVTVNVTDGQVR